jgi:hypothetical protein
MGPHPTQEIPYRTVVRPYLVIRQAVVLALVSTYLWGYCHPKGSGLVALLVVVVVQHFAHLRPAAMDLCWAHRDLISRKYLSAALPVFGELSSVERDLFLFYLRLVLAHQAFLGEFVGRSAVLSLLPMPVVHPDCRRRRRVLELQGLFEDLSYPLKQAARYGGVQDPPNHCRSLLQPKDYSTSFRI